MALAAKMSEAASVDKSVLAFLNGLSKRIYFQESDITDDFLRNEVLGGVTEEGSYTISYSFTK